MVLGPRDSVSYSEECLGGSWGCIQLCVSESMSALLQTYVLFRGCAASALHVGMLRMVSTNTECLTVCRLYMTIYSYYIQHICEPGTASLHAQASFRAWPKVVNLSSLSTL